MGRSGTASVRTLPLQPAAAGKKAKIRGFAAFEKIAASSFIQLRSDASLSLAGAATLASCFNGTARIAFEWNVSSVAPYEGATVPAPEADLVPVALDPRTRLRRSLTVEGSKFKQGVRYTLRLRGCMAEDLTVCGQAQVDFALIEEPLVAAISGSDRKVPLQSPFTLSACEGSRDPDDASAQCDDDGDDCGTLRFYWRCAGASSPSEPCAAPDGTPLMPPSRTSCVDGRAMMPRLLRLSQLSARKSCPRRASLL